MKITFELHVYACELTKVFANGVDITKRIQGLNLYKLTVQLLDYRSRVQYVRSCIRRGVSFARKVTIRVRHSDANHLCCDKDYRGVFTTSKDLLGIRQALKKKHNLPDAKIEIAFG